MARVCQYARSKASFFRQSFAQSFESFPAVLHPRDDEFFIHEIAMLVFFRGNEPSRIGIIWVDGNREAKIRGSHILDLISGPSSVVRAIDRRVKLDSESVGLTAALDHAVGGLAFGIVSALILREKVVFHSVSGLLPVFSFVISLPGSATGNSNGNAFRIVLSPAQRKSRARMLRFQNAALFTMMKARKARIQKKSWSETVGVQGGKPKLNFTAEYSG